MFLYLTRFRVRAAGYSLRRRPANIGRYIMLQEHHVRAEVGKDRYGTILPCYLIW